MPLVRSAVAAAWTENKEANHDAEAEHHVSSTLDKVVQPEERAELQEANMLLQEVVRYRGSNDQQDDNSGTLRTVSGATSELVHKMEEESSRETTDCLDSCLVSQRKCRLCFSLDFDACRRQLAGSCWNVPFLAIELQPRRWQLSPTLRGPQQPPLVAGFPSFQQGTAW